VIRPAEPKSDAPAKQPSQTPAAPAAPTAEQQAR
jgi:hypothetical protein